MFSKTCKRPWIRSLSNPNTLTRMPPTQCALSGEIRSAAKLSRRPSVASTRCRSLGEGGWGGHPRGPRGTQGDSRAPSAPLGGMGPWGYSGAIPNEKPFRMEGLLRNHSELKAVARESRPTGDSSKCHQNCFETSGWLGTMCAI